MEQKALWELFMDTGAPEAFLLYRRSCRNLGEETEERMERPPVCE